ncbi:MAG: DUF4238 domain-containing protein [Calothrix sp. FI2-JRJ7]|jgi:hypothetical protein|nr:DUF4238 domain-containing protein [Calothrix sp. FI2-JRJ7]
MRQVINQHYVPQSYLKNFSPDGSQVFVFDKFNKRSFVSNVRNVASERTFYDFPQSVTQPQNIQIIEQFFSKLESRQERFLRHLQRKINKVFDLRFNPEKAGKIYTLPILTEDQKQDLACVAAVQFLRTKEFRNFLVEMRQATEPLASHMLESEILSRINHFESATSIKLDEDIADFLKSLLLYECNSTLSHVYDDGLAVVHAKAIFEYYEQILEIFRNHIWIIGVNDMHQPLFTSDHPVVRRSHLSSCGLASEGVEIAFPLNSKSLLIMREKQFFHKYKDKESKLFPLTLEDVEYYNMLQVYDSNRFVFCAEDRFDLVRSICQEHPGVCSKDRSRVQVRVTKPT